jgi:sarcosine oxidase subunit beta
VVLERKTVASGASGGPGHRGVRANWRDRRELPLMREAYPVWESLHDVLGEDGLFERQGNLKLIGREQDVPMAHAQAWLQNNVGVETHVLDAAQVYELEPHMEPGILGGVLCPLDGSSDHTKTTRAYAAAARRAGAVIREQTEAEGIVYAGGKATGVQLSDGGMVEAAVGVLVLSNWSVADLLRGQAEIPVWSEALQVLVSKPLAEVPNRHVISHTNRTLSLKPEPGNRVMISGGYRGHYDRKTHIGTAIQPSIDANVADAMATYPSLAGIEIEVADAGHLESLSIDQVPVIDRLPECPNLWYGTGWCGHGWAIAPVVSELLARYVLEQTCPDLLRPFALARFG